MALIQLDRAVPWAALSLVTMLACADRQVTSIDDLAPDGGAALDAGAGVDWWAELPVPERMERQPRPNPIPEENQEPGDPDWQKGYRAHNGELMVFATTESLRAGEPLGVKVSADKPTEVTAQVFRMGWYGGARARQVWAGGPFAVAPQAPCELSPTTGKVDCEWQVTFEVPVGGDWLSGLYVVKLFRADGQFKRFAPFIVRDDRAAEILFTPNVTTWQAYNAFGGESLYYDEAGVMPSGRAWLVSFDRPYDALDGRGKTFDLDLHLISFLERHGYDATYASQVDFLRFENLLEGIPAMVHGGQDEYWFEPQRDQVDAALASGKTSLAYFGGNGAYWRSRMISGRDGTPLRILACYKSEPLADPFPYSTVRFRNPPHPRPENNLFGNMYEGWQLVPFPLVVGDAGHWLFEGTSLLAGEQLHGLVGFEYDRAFSQLAGYPQGVQVSMESPVVSAEGVPSHASTVDRVLPSGTTVFAAGTIWWSRGLSPDPRHHDARVERMTLNVLERSLGHHRRKRALGPAGSRRPAQAAPDPRWAQDVAWYSGKEGRGADGGALVDGPSATARFHSPTGLAFTAEGALVVADTGNNRLRIIGTDPQRTVGTLAGNGDLGYRDGPAAQAMFRVPTAVAKGPSGELYVADSDNHVIRRLDRDASGAWIVSTAAGKGFQAGFQDGAASQARFHRPTALAVDGQGNVFVADQVNNRIRRISAVTAEVTTIAGNGEFGAQDAVTGTLASFDSPSAIAVADDGTLYVLDAGSQRLRRIAPNATWSVSAVAGDPDKWGGAAFADGGGKEARFAAQMGMAVDASGAIILADTANYRLRRIEPGPTWEQTRVFTLAGNGRFGTARGGGEVANLVAPAGVTVGPGGRLYVTDPFHHQVLEVTPGPRVQ